MNSSIAYSNFFRLVTNRHLIPDLPEKGERE